MITNNLRDWSRFARELQRIKTIFPEYAKEIKNCRRAVAEKIIVLAELAPATTVEELTAEAENLRLCGLCGFPLDKRQRKFCSKICDAISKRKTYVKARYVLLNVGKRRVYLHRLIWEKNNGRKLRRDEDVHHVNENPLDNRPANLQALSKAEHARLHHELRRRNRDALNRNFWEIGW